jgi:hypothetical protein
MSPTDLRRLWAVVLAYAWAAVSCSQVSPPSPSPPRGTCASSPGFDCSNAIDAALLPILAKDGVNPMLANDAELCRRYAIDIRGVTPSFADYQDHCRGKSPGEMTDYFMQGPSYVRVNQRLWADAFLYDNRSTWFQYITDLDAQVGALYRGTLSYPDFVAVSVAHPAFVARFLGENVVANAYQNFLGRDALPEERQDLLALYRMWRLRRASDPRLTYSHYGACADTSQCDDGRICESGYCTDRGNYLELYLDPTKCAGPLGAIACRSTMTGASVVLPGTEPISLGSVTPDQWEILRAPGRAVAKLPGFWETACDAALRKYTGWWIAGYELPGYEVSEVRASLAAFFRQTGGNIRKLEREVLTSALYTAAATPQDPNDTVPWHRGPTKQMTAETWLDSVGAIAGVGLGSCDWRYPSTSARFLPPTLVPPQGQVDGINYADAARVLGGCPDQTAQVRVTNAGVLVAKEQRDVLAAACRSTAATTVAGTPDAASLVRQFWRSAFLHDPTDLQVAATASVLPGSDTATAAALCEVLPRTNPFLFY